MSGQSRPGTSSQTACSFQSGHLKRVSAAQRRVLVHLLADHCGFRLVEASFSEVAITSVDATTFLRGKEVGSEAPFAANCGRDVLVALELLSDYTYSHWSVIELHLSGSPTSCREESASRTLDVVTTLPPSRPSLIPSMLSSDGMLHCWASRRSFRRRQPQLAVPRQMTTVALRGPDTTCESSELRHCACPYSSCRWRWLALAAPHAKQDTDNQNGYAQKLRTQTHTVSLV